MNDLNFKEYSDGSGWYNSKEIIKIIDDDFGCHVVIDFLDPFFSRELKDSHSETKELATIKVKEYIKKVEQ